MVVTNRLDDLLVAQAPDHPRPEDGVLLDQRTLTLVQLSRLVQDPVGDPYLAHVVQSRGLAQGLDVLEREAESDRDVERVTLYPRRVAFRVGIFGLQSGAQLPQYRQLFFR